MLKRKKGSIQDLMLIGVVALFFGIVVLIAFKITTEYNTQIQSMDIMPEQATSASTKLTGYFPGIIDNSFLFLIIGLSMVTLILAALVRVHPIFIPLFIIAWIFVIFLAGVFSNIYSEMASSPQLAAEAAQLSFITFILKFLPTFVGIFGMLIMVVLYKLGNIE